MAGLSPDEIAMLPVNDVAGLLEAWHLSYMTPIMLLLNLNRLMSAQFVDKDTKKPVKFKVEEVDPVLADYLGMGKTETKASKEMSDAEFDNMMIREMKS